MAIGTRLTSSQPTSAVAGQLPERESATAADPQGRRRDRGRDPEARRATVAELVELAARELAAAHLELRPAPASLARRGVVALVVRTADGGVLRELDEAALRQLATGWQPPGSGIALDCKA